jgi:hypothetical protein
VRRSTRILLTGLGLSGLVLASGYINTLRLERHLSALQTECESQASSKGAAHGPWEKYAAQGSDTVPVRMPDGDIVHLPKKLDAATAKQLRAELDEAIARSADVSKKAAEDFVPDTADAVPPDKVPPGANVYDQFDDPPPKWALDYARVAHPQYKDLSDEEVARRLHQNYAGPAWAHAPLVCDADNLGNSGALVGIQAKIVDVDRAVRNSTDWPLPVALALFGLSATPWLWYALLRRIGELRAAIGGNPPER